MSQRQYQLTPLESAVLAKMLFDKDGPVFEVMRQQLAAATILSRTLTGAGFWLDFVIPADTPVRRDLPDLTINGVGAEIDGLDYGAGFVLFVRDGAVSQLEGYSYEETWWVDLAGKFTLYEIPGQP